jgi:N6-adenosine-specific RNA methylase IME4
MSVPAQLTLFDYGALDSETRIVIQQRTGEIKSLMKRAAQDIIDIGEKLADVRQRLEDGLFSQWLRAEFDWGRSTAYNLIQVAKAFGGRPVQNLDIRPSALYTLSAPSTPEPARQEAIERATAGEAITYTAARAIVQEHQARLRVEREEMRTARDAALPTPPLPSATGPFDVLYVDPPWRYEHSQTDSRRIENHYPTMELTEICDLDIPAIAAPDCVLFCWATSPKLAEALQVLTAWGFNYRTCAVWVKDQIGMGYYWRQRHELLLLATRGTPASPDPSDRPDSVIQAPRQEHSAKPEQVYAMIEAMFPRARRAELFARESGRKGWSSWGNEVRRAS